MLSNDQLEEAVLSLLVFSDEQAAMLALRISDANIFSNKTNIAIAKAALTYVNQYQSPPKHQLEFILEGSIKRGEEGRLIAQTLESLAKKAPQYQPGFVLSELDKFLDTQKFQSALGRALELSQQGDLEAAKEAAYGQFSIKSEENQGIWLNNPTQALSFLNEKTEHEYFTSGVDVLDRKGIRPERKTMFLFIGAAKAGKSWGLVQVTKGGIQYHHKVLYITLEMSDEKVSRRLIQSIFSLTKQEAAQVSIPRFVVDASGTFTYNFSEFTRPGIPEKRRSIASQLIGMNPKVLVKQFPTGQLSLQHLGLYLDSLERDLKFRPDLLVLDYADLMRISADDLRIQTGNLYKGLRGIAVNRDIALVTASQGNRDSDTAKLVTGHHVAEDWSKIGTADNTVTINKTLDERKMNLARLFVAAGRDDEDRFIVLISQAYTIGQFCIDSVLMNTNVANVISGSSDSDA